MNNVRLLRLLLITGDQDNSLITRDLLNETSQLPHQLDCVSDNGEALTAIECQVHDLHLVDYRLGEQDCLDLIARAQGLGVKAPIILLTAQRDGKLDASAIDMAPSGLPDQGTVRHSQPGWHIRYAIGQAQIATARGNSKEGDSQFMTDSRDAILEFDRIPPVRYASLAAEPPLEHFSVRAPGSPKGLPAETGLLDKRSESLAHGKILDIAVQCSLAEGQGRHMHLPPLRDIRASTEPDKQLRLFRCSLEASYNGVLICDAFSADLPIIYTNPAFERITGYHTDEVIGRNCRFLQGEEQDQPCIEEIRQGLKEGRETHVVLRNFRKDGTPFWNALRIVPVPDEQGEISHFIGILSDISEQKCFETQLAHNASHDVLTGLPNRSLLADRLTQGCQISRRYQRRLAVICINLDGFQPINDSIGNSAGDQLLVEVALRMSRQVRPGDTLARLGGDEFVIILPDLAREEDVLLVADRLISSIAQPYNIDGIEIHITASIGISLSDGTSEPPTLLLQQADLAMRRAKQQGRNNYQWYTQDLCPRVSERIVLRNELQKAIEAEAFQLYYQPQVDSLSGRVIGYEALLRWEHADHGFISPARFVPLAESTGQIIPLGEWVLRTACRHARLLLDQGWSGNVMAVNISPVQFQRANFIGTVCAVLEETGLPPEMLELEITETVLLDNAEKAIHTLHALKDFGVHISIDDFGTGFSSLNYLKRLPVDKIKIDRSFIHEVISDRHDAAITCGIISMAHHLGLKVIAEGVETESQAAFLKRNRCDALQGYYFATPMPLALLSTFLQEQHEKRHMPHPGQTAAGAERTLLLLDDEVNILHALTRLLRRDGYQILVANHAQDAFALLAKHEVHVILSGQRMPEMSGTEFLCRVKDLYPNTICIVLSGYTDLKSATSVINKGAIYRFLTKPWDDAELRATVAQAFLSHA